MPKEKKMTVDPIISIAESLERIAVALEKGTVP